MGRKINISFISSRMGRYNPTKIFFSTICFPYGKNLVSKLISNNPNESRKDWILSAFLEAGKNNSLNKNFQLWQNFNSPTLLDSNYLIDQKTTYIHNNPVMAGFVTEPNEYYYSSANENGPLFTFDF